MELQNWISLVINLGTSTAYALILLYFVLSKISKALDGINEQLTTIHKTMDKRFDHIETRIDHIDHIVR